MSQEILEKARREQTLRSSDVAELIALSDPDEIHELYDIAYQIKEKYVGTSVYLRGLIECSNICRKDCYYCGIRKSNEGVRRFQMDEDEIVREALWSFQQGYGSVVIQAGERSNPDFIDTIERVLIRVKAETGGRLGITLSLGEQSENTYRRWREAGAHRYLLRIETTNAELYRQLHPEDHHLEQRYRCLNWLKDLGYQVGTGVMIGLPGQTFHDLANDVLFMKSLDVDIVGMGPYIPHKDTPLGEFVGSYDDHLSDYALTLGLKMIAVVRIVLKDINIAAATSLQTLDLTGREKGLQCGANIIMPGVTASELRPDYSLYDNKPEVNECSLACQNSLEQCVLGIGETIGYDQWGDSQHYFERVKQER